MVVAEGRQGEGRMEEGRVVTRVGRYQKALPDGALESHGAQNRWQNKLPSVSIIEILSIAIAALWSNILRPVLTMLGVIIGITAVIAVTSVG